MAKKFFYVCAGLLFMGLLSWRITNMASAQTSGSPFVAIVDKGGAGAYMAIDARGAVYVTQDFGSTWTFRSLIGGTSFTALAPEGTLGQVIALESSGWVWFTDDDGATWTKKGCVGLEPVPVTSRSWGALKAETR